MKSAALDWYRLHWPREVALDQLRALSLVLATTSGVPAVIESVGRAGAVEHTLGLRAERAAATVDQLRAALPDLGLVAFDRRPFEARRAVEIRLSTAQRALRAEQSELVSRAVLTALAHTRHGERVILHWRLLGTRPPTPVGSAKESGRASVADVLLGRPNRLDTEARHALRAKRALPVWRAIGCLAVRAATTTREQMLLRELVAALHLADAPGVQITVKSCSASRIDTLSRSWFAPLRLNSVELVAVAGWPIGETTQLPVEHSRTRLLAPAKAIPGRGRVVGASTLPGRERPIGLRATDALRHLHVLGPTGTGKSTLLLNLITQDIAAGRGVVVVDPKGDLIADVLERIPHGRFDDVVLLDPAGDRRPVGLNPLATHGRPPELVADQLLALFRGMYESWGPRTNDILAASLLTLARTPGMTLCALPALLGDAGFRHRIVPSLDDPLGLGSFWTAYEAWSEAERTAAIAPTMSRVRPFLLRPQLRAVLGQSDPRFELWQVFVERRVLLVNLGKGSLGTEAASLLGSLILTQLWAAALRRATIAPPRRHPVFVYVDEVQDYLRLPTDVGEALVQARGLGVGFVLAHQHLSQLDPSTRSAVLSNARSRVCFQLAAEDARALATAPLTSDDLRGPSAFEMYAQLVADGVVQPWCSGRTLPASDPISRADHVRRRSGKRWGVDPQIVDAEIERLLGGAQPGVNDLSPRRRDDRGAK